MQTLYVRYNRHRLAPFQLETSIVESNGSRIVVKKALTGEAKDHLRAMRSGYDLVKRNLKSDSLLLPLIKGVDGSAISFQYIEGLSLDQALFQAFRADDKDAFFRTIEDYCALLKGVFGFTEQPAVGAKARDVFGVGDASQLNNHGGWLPLAVVDAVFENIIISGKSRYLIDNEWIFEGALPFGFLLFRSLFYFHKVKYFEYGIEKWIPFASLLERYKISPEQAQKYLAMDESFQGYVYGAERCYKYKEQYKKRQISVHSLERTIEHQRDVVRKYHGEIVRMRGILAEKERIIDEIVNSAGWRLWQKITGALDIVCPKGSKRRQMADRLIAFLTARRSSL